MISYLFFVLYFLQSNSHPVSILNSLQDCSNGPHTGHIVTISMDPSAPISGDFVQITIDYNLDTTITSGMATYTASFNGFPLTPTTEDLCTDLSNTTSPCPIYAGLVHYQAFAQIGDGNVHGTVSTTTTWKDQNGDQILCFGFTVRI